MDNIFYENKQKKLRTKLLTKLMNKKKCNSWGREGEGNLGAFQGSFSPTNSRSKEFLTLMATLQLVSNSHPQGTFLLAPSP